MTPEQQARRPGENNTMCDMGVASKTRSTSLMDWLSLYREEGTRDLDAVGLHRALYIFSLIRLIEYNKYLAFYRSRDAGCGVWLSSFLHSVQPTLDDILE
jgi:hypothetical protein